MNSKIKVAFDVSGTLVYHLHNKLVPRQPVIDMFKMFESLGCQMFVWSGAGIEFAEQVTKQLGLQATIVEKWSFKPDITVDDDVVCDGKINLAVPMQFLNEPLPF